MKLLVDSNVVLDLFDANRPGVKESLEILDYCQLEMLQGYFAVFSTSTILYILRKKFRRPSDQKAVIEGILNTLKPVETEADDLFFPFEHNFSDYEDGLQSAAASRVKADYIITHNLKDFKTSPVPPITPEKFVKSIIVGKS